MRLAALLIAVAAAEEFRANLDPMIEATRWWTDGGAPPAHWVVHGESDLDYLKQPAISSTIKEVFEARFRNTSVVVKWVKDGAQPARHEAFTEIVFLEYCRGGPGIPRLLGAYRNENGTVVWVVEKVGESIGQSTMPNGRKEGVYPKWRAFVEAAPLDAARAIFRCFRSFSELGGFFMNDLHMGQFAFFEGALYAIDGLQIAAGPARDFVDNAANVARFVGKLPLRHTNFNYCKKIERKTRVANSFKYNITYRNINETQRNEKCRRVANNRHVKDVATKPYLLPFVIGRSAGDDRKKLMALSSTMLRPAHKASPQTFTALLEALG